MKNKIISIDAQYFIATCIIAITSSKDFTNIYLNNGKSVVLTGVGADDYDNFVEDWQNAISWHDKTLSGFSLFYEGILNWIYSFSEFPIEIPLR